MHTDPSRRKRVCFLLKVRQDRLEEYELRHQAVRPDMQSSRPLPEFFHLE